MTGRERQRRAQGGAVRGSGGRRAARPGAHVGSAELTSLRPDAFAHSPVLRARVRASGAERSGVAQAARRWCAGAARLAAAGVTAALRARGPRARTGSAGRAACRGAGGVAREQAAVSWRRRGQGRCTGWERARAFSGRPSWAGRCGVRGSGQERGRGRGGRKEGEKRKEKRKEKKKKRKGGKEMGKRKRNREKEKWEGRKEKEGGRCAPAATASAVGHAWRAAAGGGGTRLGEREEEGEGKKEGRDSRRPVTTRRVGWERDGTRIKIRCRVVRERLWEFRVQGLSRAQR